MVLLVLFFRFDASRFRLRIFLYVVHWVSGVSCLYENSFGYRNRKIRIDFVRFRLLLRHQDKADGANAHVGRCSCAYVKGVRMETPFLVI